MTREGVTRGYPLLVVLHKLALLPLTEGMRRGGPGGATSMVSGQHSNESHLKAMKEADPGVLHPWYLDDAEMRGTARCNSNLLRAFMEKVPHNGYFLELEKSCHICAEGK